MDNDQNFYPINCKDSVIQIPDIKNRIQGLESMFRVGALVPQVERSLVSTNQMVRTQSWFNSGVACEMLKLEARQWQPGKLRIRVVVEFCPDEPDEPDEPEAIAFPLDEIRQTLDSAGE